VWCSAYCVYSKYNLPLLVLWLNARQLLLYRRWFKQTGHVLLKQQYVQAITDSQFIYIQSIYSSTIIPPPYLGLSLETSLYPLKIPTALGPFSLEISPPLELSETLPWVPHERTLQYSFTLFLTLLLLTKKEKT